MLAELGGISGLETDDDGDLEAEMSMLDDLMDSSDEDGIAGNGGGDGERSVVDHL